MIKGCRRAFLFSVLFGFLMGWETASVAAEPTYQFDIPAEPLGRALTDFSQIASQPIILSEDLVKGRITGGIHGRFTAAQALRALLQGTDLVAETNPAGVLMVRKKEAVPRSEVPNRDMRSGYDADLNDVLSVIVVTAQKREQRLIDVPISIVALSGSELQKRNIVSIDDLSTMVPGLSIQSSGAFQRRIQLRGISNLSGTLPLIGMYLDEADVTSASLSQPDLRTYDLKRVEVLRGPQGTLYGEGSAGGTIRFISNEPALDGFDFNADVQALFTQAGAPSQRIESMINIPLIDNELGIRIAGAFDHEGGWIDQPSANVRDFNESNLADARIKGLWQPTQQFSVNATALVHRNGGANNSGEDDNGNYTADFNLAAVPSAKDNFDIFNLTLSYDFPKFRLLNTSSYIDQDKDTRNLGQPIPLFGPAGVVPLFDSFQLDQFISTSTWIEELRLSSTGTGRWQWTVGGYYRYSEFNFNAPTIFSGTPGPPGSPLPPPSSYAYTTISKSRAAFGDAGYKLLDRLTVGVGLRWFEDTEVDREPTLGYELAPNFHAISPRYYALFKLSDSANLYASAARGFRSGGNNGPGLPDFDSEYVWTYESGLKFVSQERRWSADVSVFLSDYNDFQITGQEKTPPFLTFTSNAGNARIKGVEWDFAWSPTPDWSFSLTGDYVNAKFVQINLAPGTSTYNPGDPVDLIPRYEITGAAQRDFRVAGRSAFVRFDYNRLGPSTNRDRTIGPWWYSESDVIDKLNFNSRIQWNDNLSFGLLAQNLLNDRGRLDALSAAGLASRLRPRTYGVDFRVTY